MKIKLYIVTYNHEEYLNRCLKSIYDNKINDIEVNVISNHSNIKYDPIYPIKLLNNMTRPDFSTGHLSRNWNQGIINGFKDVKNPDCDILILCQNDIVFAEKFDEKIVNMMKNFDYIQMGIGDECQIFNIKAVKKIGIYDERFCNIGFQEADYFIRAKNTKNIKVSINDFAHGRVHNGIENEIIDHKLEGRGLKNNEEKKRLDFHKESRKFHEHSLNVYREKYGSSVMVECWNDKSTLDQLPKQYMFYPYFEYDLDDVDKKYFI